MWGREGGEEGEGGRERWGEGGGGEGEEEGGGVQVDEEHACS